jgi:hypothetical protein
VALLFCFRHTYCIRLIDRDHGIYKTPNTRSSRLKRYRLMRYPRTSCSVDRGVGAGIAIPSASVWMVHRGGSGWRCWRGRRGEAMRSRRFMTPRARPGRLHYGKHQTKELNTHPTHHTTGLKYCVRGPPDKRERESHRRSVTRFFCPRARHGGLSHCAGWLMRCARVL